MADAEVADLLRDHGAGELVTHVPDVGLLATLIPFVHDPGVGEHGTLRGHLARNNDQWRLPATGESMVILRGPDGYVSPDWYATKREHGRVVPTWDYVAVHVYGELVVHDDVEFVRRVVHDLTTKHESSRATPWAVSDAPPRYIEGQLRAIVGVELRVTRVVAKAKLSQNRSAEDMAGVVAGLRESGQEQLAVEVAAAARPPDT
jgi:transcriptional regulator